MSQQRVLMLRFLFLISLASACLLSCKRDFETPELISSGSDLYELALPKNYPVAFEPHLAVRQGKPVVGYIGLTANPASFIFKRRVFYTNGSKTISPSADIYGDDSSTGGADPVLDFDHRGNACAVNLINYTVGDDTRNAIHFVKLNPIDLSILETTLIGEHSKKGNLPNNTREPDKCWIKVNKQTGHIYVAWSGIGNDASADIYFAKSLDGGATFSEPIPIVKNGRDNFYVQLEFLDANTIVLIWDVRGQGILQACFSYDNGDSFGEPRTIFTNPSANNINETMGPVLTKNTDGSLTLAVSILRNNQNFRIVALESVDNGRSWSQVGSQIEHAMLSTFFKSDNKRYLIGYRLSNTLTQYNLWQFDQGSWAPKLIKQTSKDGYKLNAGDYVGTVVEGNAVYSAYVFLTKNGERKVYVTKIDL